MFDLARVCQTIVGFQTDSVMHNIVVLLPAYNEEISLEPLLTKIGGIARDQDWNLRVIVGDDGSSDSTPEVLARLVNVVPIEVLTHKLNRGLGETSRDLFERAIEIIDDDDIVIRMDCDDTHEPKYMVDLVNKLTEGYDVAICSRFQKGGNQIGVNAYRATISYGANLFMKTFFPVRGVWDYTCGFRAYRGAILRRAIAFYRNDFIQIKGLGFTCTLEKLVKLNMLGARFAEVPFTLRYDQKLSSSKMVSSLTMLGYLAMAVMHYWPWGGWRRTFRRRLRAVGDNALKLPPRAGVLSNRALSVESVPLAPGSAGRMASTVAGATAAQQPLTESPHHKMTAASTECPIDCGEGASEPHSKDDSPCL